MPYYGLYIPIKNNNGVGVVPGNTSSASSALNGTAADRETAKSTYVFHKKIDALEILKQHKDARLREFLDEDEAVKYAQTGYEVVQSKYNDSKAPSASLEKAAFRAPTKQELIEFRKIIESGDCERVQKIIWDNPRYLVSSGDTPTSLKDGYRYNAMHVCAIAKRPKVAELILKTVSDTNFADLLTGKKNDIKMCEELCINLLDYYLNMPEKGRNETPLHLAAKVGCVAMVEVLISYAECKMTRNSMNLLPADIICSRDVGSEPYAYNTIKMLLEEHFYVPVLRCNDGSFPAQIGQPFSPNSPPNLACDPLSPELEVKALAGPMGKSEADRFFRRWKNPTRIDGSITSPVVNKLFISPVKTPSQTSLNNTPHRVPMLNKQVGGSPTATLRRRALFNSSAELDATNEQIINPSSLPHESNGNCNKSIQTLQCDIINNEQLNNQTNNNNEEVTSSNIEAVNNLKQSLCSITPLLKRKTNAFFTYRESCVISSPLVDNACANSSDELCLMNTSEINFSPAYMERHIKNSDPEKGLEYIGRELAKEQSVEWREYWDFLEDFVDITTPKGLEKFENYLMRRQCDVNSQNEKTANTSVILDNVCTALEKFSFTPKLQKASNRNWGRERHCENDVRQDSNKPSHLGVNATITHQMSTPYKYVEKSLQVHARRMTKTIIHNIDNVTSINDSLVLELRRVKSLIYSFKEDETFFNVTFEKVHSRIGNLVSTFLENSHEVTFSIKEKIMNILQKLIVMPGERREHMECVLIRIRNMLEHPVEQILSENLQTEEICFKIWSQEKDCNCSWESNLSRKTSRRNRMEARYKNHLRPQHHEESIREQSHPFSINYSEKNANDEWHIAFSSNDSSEEDDVFWEDAYSDVTCNDEESDTWFTPPDSPCHSRQEADFRDVYDGSPQHIFIYGNEPTKRDLDVLNAIFHVDIDTTKYPNIYAWKAALMRYPNNELDYFPSPHIVKKSYSITLQHLNKSDSISQIQLNRSENSASFSESSKLNNSLLKACNDMVREQMKKQVDVTCPSDEPMNTVKKVLALSSSIPKILNEMKSVNNGPTSTPNSPVAAELKRQNQELSTPANKRRGLFSSYRDHLDNSPSDNLLSNGIASNNDNSSGNANNDDSSVFTC